MEILTTKNDPRFGFYVKNYPCSRIQTVLVLTLMVLTVPVLTVLILTVLVLTVLVLTVLVLTILVLPVLVLTPNRSREPPAYKGKQKQTTKDLSLDSDTGDPDRQGPDRQDPERVNRFPPRK